MTYPLHFLICNFIISILFAVCLLINKFTKKHLTVNARYILWYAFAFFLVLPFLPESSSALIILPAQIKGLLSQFSISAGEASSAFSSLTRNLSGQLPDLADYPVDAASSSYASYFVLWGIWTAGILVTGGCFLCSAVRIFLLRRNASAVTWQTEPALRKEYDLCLQESEIHRRIPLYISCRICSPVCYGLFFPRIIIPEDLDLTLSREELHFIFLHELGHYKRHDSLLNTISCILQIIYWFNPIIWYGFHLMRNMREIACDHYVIKTQLFLKLKHILTEQTALLYSTICAHSNTRYITKN